MKKNYKWTLIACYLGFITQAIAANFPPLLFLTFHKSYGVPLGKIALISTIFYFTQLIMDILCAKFADKIGYRRCMIVSCLCFAAGLLGLAVLPELLRVPFSGILLSVVIYAIGSGILEVLGSPIVEACPFEHKEAVMSLLHSFYCWGSVGVVAISTAFFACFGIENWKVIACLWAIVPVVDLYFFAICPLEPLVEDGRGMGIRGLLRLPLFWLAIVLMVCAGASELSMAQWASAYAESAIGLSKAAGDLLGPCLFAVAMGLSRVFYGKFGDRVDLQGFMLGSGVLCLGCYLLASLASLPILGLLGCIVCGFSVGILWPGTISITSRAIPRGGTAMFALLAMAGDLGGSVGPNLVGNITQRFEDNLQAGMLAGAVFPLVLIAALLGIRKIQRQAQ